jgi:hypothetical protein
MGWQRGPGFESARKIGADSDRVRILAVTPGF